MQSSSSSDQKFPAPIRQLHSAAKQSSQSDFLGPLKSSALNHAAINHRWLDAFAAGSFQDMNWAAQDFAKTYFAYSAWFTRYLRAVIDRLPRVDHRAKLEENFNEESGQLDDDGRAALRSIQIDPSTVEGVPHRQLFLQFCNAVGLRSDDLQSPPKISELWRQRFLKGIENASGAFGVGAIGLGTESVVASIYEKILTGLDSVDGLTKKDVVFFELHCHVDEQHQLDLLQIAEDIGSDETCRRDLERGMQFALELRCGIWDFLWGRATAKEQIA